MTVNLNDSYVIIKITAYCLIKIEIYSKNPNTSQSIVTLESKRVAKENIKVLFLIIFDEMIKVNGNITIAVQ